MGVKIIIEEYVGYSLVESKHKVYNTNILYNPKLWLVHIHNKFMNLVIIDN